MTQAGKRSENDVDDGSGLPDEAMIVGVRGGYQPETSDAGSPPSGGGGGKEPPTPTS